MRRADPHRALIRALVPRYPGLLILTSATEPWASATFTGARHRLLCAAGMDLTGAEEAEFSLPNHIVADLSWEAEANGLVIEALTIEADGHHCSPTAELEQGNSASPSRIPCA